MTFDQEALPDLRAVEAARQGLLDALLNASRGHYGSRLVALAVFGSVGRGSARPDSDIDLLVVAEDLPDGRPARVDDFAQVEATLASRLASAAAIGMSAELSPIFKTPAELRQGSLLLLDMVDDAVILYDRERVLDEAFCRLRQRLQQLGARRIWLGNAWYWDLKPDYRQGEIFEI